MSPDEVHALVERIREPTNRTHVDPGEARESPFFLDAIEAHMIALAIILDTHVEFGLPPHMLELKEVLESIIGDGLVERLDRGPSKRPALSVIDGGKGTMPALQARED